MRFLVNNSNNSDFRLLSSSMQWRCATVNEETIMLPTPLPPYSPLFLSHILASNIPRHRDIGVSQRWDGHCACQCVSAALPRHGDSVYTYGRGRREIGSRFAWKTIFNTGNCFIGICTDSIRRLNMYDIFLYYVRMYVYLSNKLMNISRC